jgi:hypothetical protein
MKPTSKKMRGKRIAQKIKAVRAKAAEVNYPRMIKYFKIIAQAFESLPREDRRRLINAFSTLYSAQKFED